MAYQPKDLWALVNDAKADIDSQNTNHDMKLYKWAGDAVRELTNYDIFLPAGKSARIELDENNSCFLPDDCPGREAIYKVGLCMNGYILNFDLNETICLENTSLTPCSCDEIEATINTGDCGNNWWRTRCGYFGYWENGQYVAGVYGKGAGFYRGGYRIDDAQRRLQFDRFVVATSIVIEYRTEGIQPNGNAYVPSILERPIKNFIHRERCTFATENMTDKYKSRMMQQQALKFGERYVNGVKAAVGKLKFMSVDEHLATWRASIYQIPKR